MRRPRSGRDAVLVSHLDYYRHAAVALHDSRLLDRFLTAPLFGRSVPGHRLPLVGGSLEALAAGRVDPRISEIRVQRMWAAQASAVAVQHAALAVGQGSAMATRARIWNTEVALRIGRPSSVHAVMELFGPAVLRAGERGAFTICDVRAPHPRVLASSIGGFLARHGVRYRLPEARLVPAFEIALARADLLVCNSELTRETLLHAGVEPERAVVVSLGCDVDCFYPAARPPERFTIAFVGRERLAKGILELADAARAFAPGTRIMLTGHADAETVAAFAGSPVELCFAGPLDRNGMAAFYRQSSVLVLPSYGDGFGMVVLEAMSSGLPVVVSDRAGAASLVSDEIGGVVPAGEPDALAAALVRLQDDPEARMRAGSAARRAAQAHTWEAYGGRLVAAYRERVPAD